MFRCVDEIFAIGQKFGQQGSECRVTAYFVSVEIHHIRIIILHCLHPLRTFFFFALSVEVEADLIGAGVGAVGQGFECGFFRPRTDVGIGRVGTFAQAQIGVIGKHGAFFGKSLQAVDFVLNRLLIIGFPYTAILGQILIFPAEVCHAD